MVPAKTIRRFKERIADWRWIWRACMYIFAKSTEISVNQFLEPRTALSANKQVSQRYIKISPTFIFYSKVCFSTTRSIQCWTKILQYNKICYLLLVSCTKFSISLTLVNRCSNLCFLDLFLEFGVILNLSRHLINQFRPKIQYSLNVGFPMLHL
jgi:hypothetical protein